jgi:hypothetical protein
MADSHPSRQTALADVLHGALAEQVGEEQLDRIADRVRAEHNLVQWHAEGMLDAAIRAGEALVEAKGALSHGEFGPWLRGCGISGRTARTYMRLFRNRQTSAVLEADSIDAALEALTTRRRKKPVVPDFGPLAARRSARWRRERWIEAMVAQGRDRAEVEARARLMEQLPEGKD